MNSITLRPSGRLSFGFTKKDYKPRRAPRISLAQRMRNESIGVVGVENLFPGELERIAAMDLSNLSNSEKPQKTPRAKRGLRGMTGHGRLMVKDAAYWLQHEYGKERLAFWTVTIPPECLNEQLIGNWSKVVESTRKKLTYHLKKHGLPDFIVGVTEIQPKRFIETRSVPPLHLHIVFVAAHRPYVPCVHKETLASLWADTVALMSGIPCRSDTVSSVQFIKKDVVGYLGKYMSKGFYDMEGLDKNLCPSSWYFCTSNLRAIVKGLIVKHSGEWVNELYQYFRKHKDMFGFTKRVEIPIGNEQKIIVGWYGELKREQQITDAWDIIRGVADTMKGTITL